MGPRFLYLHGFASSPGSKKAVALRAHLAARGATLELLDGRVPSFERLRLSAILAMVRAAIGGAAERVVLFGSSLGGLAAARVAEDDARVAAAVLLAPAFRLAERWRERLGPEELERWRTTGWLEVFDFATGRPGRVDHGFLLDMEEVDARSGGWPDLRVPALIVHGRDDATVDIDASRRFARGRRHVRLVEVDDGHELVASLPRIAAEVDRFLEPFLGPAG
jgi:hypothetical protein